jgi:hypothetical protein
LERKNGQVFQFRKAGKYYNVRMQALETAAPGDPMKVSGEIPSELEKVGYFPEMIIGLNVRNELGQEFQVTDAEFAVDDEGRRIIQNLWLDPRPETDND